MIKVRQVLRCYAKSIIPVLILLALTGCADRIDQDQIVHQSAVMLEPGQSIGQTFVARHAGLDGIEIGLGPAESSQGEIHLYLRADPNAEENVGTAVLQAAQISKPAFYRFSFPPQSDSQGRYLYAFLEMQGNGAIWVGTGSGNTYVDGSLYQQHEPFDGQLVFRLTYDPMYLLLDSVQAGLRGLGRLFAACMLYIVPGWALLLLFQSACQCVVTKHWAEGLGVAAGMSLSLYPLLLLGTDVVGLYLGPLYAWLPLIAGVAVILAHYRPWQWQWTRVRIGARNWLRSGALWPDAALTLVVSLALLGRFVTLRSLDMPLWGDSVEHVTIVRRILESGGLFRSWEPYAPYTTLSSHFGFHANTAAWSWLTGMDASQSVLWVGQILNLLAVLTLFPLAYRIKGIWAGVVTVLVAGILIKFPAFYINWGRYPQLSGQVILPIAAWWLWVGLESERVSRKNVLLFTLGAGLLVAGAALNYYRMVFHYAAFVVAALIALSIVKRRVLKKWSWLALFGVAIVSCALLFPWFYKMSTWISVSAVPDKASSLQGMNQLWEQVQAVYVSLPAPGAAVVLLGTLAGLWLGGAAALPVIWLWILVSLPVLRLLPVPGVWMIQEFTIETSLYIPYALILGVLGGHLGDRMSTGSRWRSAALVFLILGLGMWRFPSLLEVTDRKFDLSGRPDLRAAEWIKKSLPEDTFFLINGIVHPDGVSAAGSDGGWWLPVLTQRGVTIPPQYALLGERPSEPGYSDAVNQLVRHLFEVSPVSKEGKEAICRFPGIITHVYLGQRQGMVAHPDQMPSHPLLPAQMLLSDPAFRLVYHQDRVMIFEFDRSTCP